MSYKKRDLDYYMNLNWTYLIETEDVGEEKIFVITCNELPGVATDADSIEEGMAGIKEAIEAAISLYLKHGDEIPEPIDRRKFKGNIAYRTSAERHYEIACTAKIHHESLSKTLDRLVDAGLGAMHSRNRGPRP